MLGLAFVPSASANGDTEAPIDLSEVDDSYIEQSATGGWGELPTADVDTSDATVVMQWNMLALQATIRRAIAPMVTARMLSMLNSAMYEAWVPYDDKAASPDHCTSLRRPAAERTLANKQRAMSYAAYRVLLDVLPLDAAVFESKMLELGYDPTDTSSDVTLAEGIGNTVAFDLLEWRHYDGANQLGDLNPGPYSDYTGYTPVNSPTQVVDIDRWQPLLAPDGNPQRFLTPHWKNVTPFALTSSDQFLPAGPVFAVETADFLKQSKEVVSLSANLTDQQKVIAEFWAAPGCQWCQIAFLISQRNQHTEDQDVRMLFALHNASLDATIAVWDAKIAYDSVRPITTIRSLFANKTIRAWAGPGLGTQYILGSQFRPYLLRTPPFGEYVSGHSGNSAASAEVLARFTGSTALEAYVYVPAGASTIEPGVTPAVETKLKWMTFREAADEAGISRRYGGIHFKAGDLDGRRVGRQVGRQAYSLAKQYFSGLCSY